MWQSEESPEKFFFRGALKFLNVFGPKKYLFWTDRFEHKSWYSEEL